MPAGYEDVRSGRRHRERMQTTLDKIYDCVQSISPSINEHLTPVTDPLGEPITQSPSQSILTAIAKQ